MHRRVSLLLLVALLLAACAPRQTVSVEQRLYTVAKGDTLYSIATRFGVEVSDLQQANALDGTTIHPGQVLKIPKPTPSAHPISFSQVGVASWYGPNFNGRRTASGEVFDMYELTAAHRSLPFGTLVRVTRLDNGASVVVRINDRGPFKKDRIIDLSYAAALKIGLVASGTATVRLEVVSWGN